ncbi:uncharacterized protein LOC116347315 [Contarinia nasturtii]|uniref:uncharacterized protein LOC116347315 n=1 Tax=Contarinia nasturtii TaxID=265458 RepID=UPI0012D405D4|nr:uncharacterized protein LOC116347315 [Contarinia nasturtii]
MDDHGMIPYEIFQNMIRELFLIMKQAPFTRVYISEYNSWYPAKLISFQAGIRKESENSLFESWPFLSFAMLLIHEKRVVEVYAEDVQISTNHVNQSDFVKFADNIHEIFRDKFLDKTIYLNSGDIFQLNGTFDGVYPLHVVIERFSQSICEMECKFFFRSILNPQITGHFLPSGIHKRDL